MEHTLTWSGHSYTIKPLQAYTEGHLELFFIYNKADADFVKGHMYKFMMEGWHGIVNKKQKMQNHWLNILISNSVWCRQTNFLYRQQYYFEEVKNN